MHICAWIKWYIIEPEVIACCLLVHIICVLLRSEEKEDWTTAAIKQNKKLCLMYVFDNLSLSLTMQL